MQVRLLGPIEVDDDDGRSVVLSAAKERSLVAALALAGGATVSTDSLITSLWGEEPPPAARKTLQTYVWNLRRSLGADRVLTEPVGYRLRINADEVDVHGFRALARKGDAALRDGNVARARRALAAAAAMWRGEPLTGVGRHTGLAADATRLEQERITAIEARLAADLAGGCHRELVGELEYLVREHPFRERLWGQLMVALYRSGRQADALAAYQRVRILLRDEMGLEPGGELKRIEAAVLRHEVDLPSPAAAGVRPTPVRYARARDGASIAYQSAGTGAVDILAIAGYVHHLDIWWNAPTDGLVHELTSMGRLTVLDKRGMGLSDRPDRVAFDDWTLDALSVLDAIDVEQAVVFGVSAGALTALDLAARHPDRVSALVLFGGLARHIVSDDYPMGHERSVMESYARNLEAGWGTGVALSSAAPSLAHDANVRSYWARYQRLSASPSAAMRYFWTVTDVDVRHLLPEIHVPTLVLHAERDLLVPLGQGKYVADHVEGAEFLPLDSDVHLICVSDVLDQVADAMTSFLSRVLAPSHA